MAFYRCGGGKQKFIKETQNSGTFTVRDGYATVQLNFHFPHGVLGITSSTTGAYVSSIDGNTVTMSYWNNVSGWTNGSMTVTAIGY